MNNKNYFIFAAAIALASCSVDEYMGENPEFTQTTKENIIGFGGGTGSMSRATSNSGEVQEKLDNHFKVYGCKSTSPTSTTYQTVFENYWVWYDTNTSSSTSNSNSWEYVGKSGKNITGFDNSTNVGSLLNDQYIKYWDYSADHYHFVAGTPYNNFTFNINTSTKAIEYAEVTGFAGHINPNTTTTPMTANPVYIAKPVKIAKNSTTGENNVYGKPVKFDFVRQQSKVRVGIYETISGYKIKDIEFYEDVSTLGTTNKNYVTLFTTTDDYFVGGNNISGTVEYTGWDTTPTYSFSYQEGSTESGNQLTKQKKWYGGKFATGILTTSSNPSSSSSSSTTTTDIIKEFYGEDVDMENTTGYFIVLPTPSSKTASALTLKCNYTLESEDNSGEEIKVTGATAAIPAAYCKWEPNKMYTYIFKISQETNGTTGTPGSDKPGLFPITFDAAVIAETEAKQGTETIINTPSITTYQEGSVTDNGIEYKTDVAIEITVQDGTQVKTPNTTEDSEGCVKVYYLGETEKTEAELVVTRPTTTTTKTVTIEENTAKFTPNATDITGATATYGYYAIEYCYKTPPSAAYKYKVIKVKKVN